MLIINREKEGSPYGERCYFDRIRNSLAWPWV